MRHWWRSRRNGGQFLGGSEGERTIISRVDFFTNFHKSTSSFHRHESLKSVDIFGATLKARGYF